MCLNRAIEAPQREICKAAVLPRPLFLTSDPENEDAEKRFGILSQLVVFQFESSVGTKRATWRETQVLGPPLPSTLAESG